MSETSSMELEDQEMEEELDLNGFPSQTGKHNRILLQAQLKNHLKEIMEEEEREEVVEEGYIVPISTSLTYTQPQPSSVLSVDSILVSLTSRNLQELNLSGGSKVNDDVIMTISEQLSSTLTSLNLYGCYEITSTAFQYIANCKLLTDLNVSSCQNVFDEAIVSLSNGCQQLKILDISYCYSITNLEPLARCILLEDLNLKGCTGLIDSSFENIASQLTLLQKIDLTDCSSISSNSIEKLVTNCKRLSILNFAFLTHLTDIAIVKATYFLNENLHILNLRACVNVNDECTEQLVLNCIHLQELVLDSCVALTDVSLKNLTSLKYLRVLDISFCRKITVDSIKSFLETMISLYNPPIFQQISIWGFQITKSILNTLQLIPELTIQCTVSQIKQKEKK